MSCETDRQTECRRHGLCFKINPHAGTKNKPELEHSQNFLDGGKISGTTKKWLINE